ncbi:hypothetical protein K488DRAFT_72877 [Vararia minispora EC-137]|uniref:Uncharacterized protein n=1 Tax=Vararia minispora EC-137 TaxID=1314806 RepID=A0ACB8QCX0_9AGAM|nr:hypothetical protein K488DRAFT_72877 [Vararia minispora EC-137]
MAIVFGFFVLVPLILGYISRCRERAKEKDPEIAASKARTAERNRAWYIEWKRQQQEEEKQQGPGPLYMTYSSCIKTTLVDPTLADDSSTDKYATHVYPPRTGRQIEVPLPARAAPRAQTSETGTRRYVPPAHGAFASDLDAAKYASARR